MMQDRTVVVALALMLAGCGESVAVDPAALKVENDTREAARQAQDVATTQARADEDAAFNRALEAEKADGPVGEP